MIDAQMIKLEARLAEIEFAIAQAHALIQWQLKITPEQAEKVYETNRALLSANAIPGMAPELSDHYAAELHDAVLRIQTMTKVFRAAVPQ